MSIHVIAYNTRLVARDKLPKSYHNLLNPAWKGEMLLESSPQWFGWMLQIMGKDKGLIYARTLQTEHLTDFLLSKEGQRLFMGLDRPVARSDLSQEQVTIKGLQLIPADPALGGNMEFYAKQAQIFSK